MFGLINTQGFPESTIHARKGERYENAVHCAPRCSRSRRNRPACSDVVSTGDEVRPLADDADKVWGYVTKGAAHIPVVGAYVVCLKKEELTDDWTFIASTYTVNAGYYDFHLGEDWPPAGWYGRVDCTADDKSAHTDFTYPEEGPVRADINLPL